MVRLLRNTAVAWYKFLGTSPPKGYAVGELHRLSRLNDYSYGNEIMPTEFIARLVAVLQVYFTVVIILLRWGWLMSCVPPVTSIVGIFQRDFAPMVPTNILMIMYIYALMNIK